MRSVGTWPSSDIISAKGHNGTAELLKIIADERDDRIPAAARFSLDVAPLIQESRRASTSSQSFDGLDVSLQDG